MFEMVSFLWFLYGRRPTGQGVFRYGIISFSCCRQCHRQTISGSNVVWSPTHAHTLWTQDISSPLQIQGTYKGFFMSKMYPAFVSSAWESFYWSKVTRWYRTTVDGRNPANHLKYLKNNLVNNGILNYQPQLVSWSRISEPSTAPITSRRGIAAAIKLTMDFRPAFELKGHTREFGGFWKGWRGWSGWLLLKVMNACQKNDESSR